MTVAGASSRKEALWLACKPKSCCYTAIVIPSGRDVWRIARTLGVPAWSFLRYFPSPDQRPDGFLIDHSGQQYRLALNKQRTKRTKTEPPCIFLLRTRGGAHRCGLGDLRPAACKSFPSELVSGVLCVRNDAGCTCRSWSLSDVDIAEETAEVLLRQQEALEYHNIVAAWNAQVAEQEKPGDFFDFLEYLLGAYDRLPAPAEAK